MTPDMLLYAVIIFVTLFVLGTLLSLKLYKWNFALFFRSALWIKIYYWIPIFLCFLLILLFEVWAAIFVSSVVITYGLRELLHIRERKFFAIAYFLTVSICFTHLILFFLYENGDISLNLLLLVGFSSVLSDVVAYFFGNFFGRHKLPIWINSKKSWEGVTGQFIGALFGYVLMVPVITPTPHIFLAFLIGLASASGDIINSIVKRELRIKDWGTTIPGHGGVLDRFSSLSFAIAASYWWMVFTN